MMRNTIKKVTEEEAVSVNLTNVKLMKNGYSVIVASEFLIHVLQDNKSYVLETS